MDKHLRPSRFETEPNSITAEKEWRHWYRTFLNFIEKVYPATTPAPAQAEGGANDQNAAPAVDPQVAAQLLQQNKLSALVNHISASIYDYISEAVDYDSAITTLQNLYVKPRSIIFNRHKLQSTKQTTGESVDQYMQTLEKLSKNCEFTTVTAEVYRQEYTRDSFINGLNSSVIRTRILENNNLTFAQAFQQARTLELAQKQSDSYSNNINNISSLSEDPSNVNSSTSTEESGDLAALKKPFNKSNNKCFFCGENRHPRSKCPANNEFCGKCGKKGHWKTVCKSPAPTPTPAVGAAMMPNLSAMVEVVRSEPASENNVQDSHINVESDKTIKQQVSVPSGYTSPVEIPSGDTIEQQQQQQDSVSPDSTPPDHAHVNTPVSTPSVATTSNGQGLKRDVTYTNTTIKDKEVTTMVDSGSDFTWIQILSNV